PGQSANTASPSPSSRTSPTCPCSTIQIQPPSQCPWLGRALKLHGHPQSQLHAMSTLPFSSQAAIVGYVLPCAASVHDKTVRCRRDLAPLGAPPRSHAAADPPRRAARGVLVVDRA